MRNWRRGYVAVSNAWRKRSSPHRTKYLEANHGPDCNRNKQTQTPPKQCTAVPAPDHMLMTYSTLPELIASAK